MLGSVLTIRLAAAEVCAVSLVSETAEREITLLDKTIFFSLYSITNLQVLTLYYQMIQTHTRCVTGVTVVTVC